MPGYVPLAHPRRLLRRFSVALAVTGLLLVAVPSFAGVGYAAGTGGTATPSSSAQAQYGKPPKPPKTVVAAAATAKSPTSSLPFTGLNLWLPVAGGMVLVLFGLGLRRQGRRRPSSR